ncbi:HIRAN domain-containing protein [methane-oxidizing endosymbiont of Gigantopelta aegis]|uniref:HIRAN domain-containing protein n=1 Tax=methane-oxidizing endosymbiont of Gigantopelta aegis TaxID=2794938 RepID=UPI0018DE1ACF|nr:HIRAN domain-containing protein [methane-oxidizing endosymbiont of Gigantopelta aegis]
MIQNSSRPFLQNTVYLQFKKDSHYILESWTAGFRCWLQDNKRGTLRRVCLPYPLLTKDGSVNTKLLTGLSLANNLEFQPAPTGVFFGLTVKESEAHHVIQASLLSLIAAIPKPVRAIAGQCRSLQYFALEAMRHVSGFEQFLQQELQHVGLAYVCAVWQLARMEQLPYVMRLMVYQRMMSESRRSILESLFELPVSKSLLKSLYKLPPEDITCDSLWHLYDLFEQPAQAKAIALCPELSPAALGELAKVPGWMVSPGLFQVLATVLNNEQLLVSIIPPAILNAPSDIRSSIQTSFSSIKTVLQLENRIYHWADKLYDNVVFPEPPFEATGELTPLRDGLALRREGRKMHNCVAGYTQQIVEGRCYFYHWHGEHPATVQLNQDREGHWLLQEYLGYANHTLPETEKVRIVNALAEAFAPYGLFIMRCSIAGTRYYHYPELEPDFNNGDRLHLQAEPDNEHDPRAVEVLTGTGHKLGYLPRHQNARVAAWLKRGLPVQATLLSDHQNGWLLQVYVASEAENITVPAVTPK